MWQHCYCEDREAGRVFSNILKKKISQNTDKLNIVKDKSVIIKSGCKQYFNRVKARLQRTTNDYFQVANKQGSKSKI